MSIADLHDLELIWPSLGPRDVIVTGTFDQWSSSIHLVKNDAGFIATVKVPWGQKIAYKFIVDGRWQCREDCPQENDGRGNMNNVLETPEKPEPEQRRDPLTRLSITLDGEPSEGYGDLDNMVTAIEFHPCAEPTEIRGPLSFPIPQITVQGLVSQVPSPVSVNESKLNTAAATEGNVSPSEVAVPSKEASSHVPLNDNGSVPLPPINGNGEASHDLATYSAVQFMTQGAVSAVPEAVEKVVVTPSEYTASQPPQSVPPPVVVLEPTAKQPEADPLETATQGQRQQAPAPASEGRASTSSKPSSNTLTPKKRRSLFARIKHIFEKDKEKKEKRKL